MTVTDEQVAMLRTLLVGDVDEHQGLLDNQRAEDRTPYGTLVIAGFCVAVARRFNKESAPADVIGFVTSVRARSQGLAAKIDPAIAERLILGVYTDESISDIDPKVRNRHYIFLLPALILDANMTGTELDELLTDARKLADSWLS